jgi:hypothetical protein
VSFDQLMPVFLSTPKSDDAIVLPLKFTGGLGLPTKTIGFMLAVQGVYSMIAQLWFFPFVVKHFGTLRTFRFVLLAWPPLYLAVPYLILLPAKLQMPAVYVALISKITLHVIAFPAIAILLANAAPTSKVLGSINGAAASTASLSRAFGPTVTGLLHSRGLLSGYSVLAWWACGLVCVVGAIQSFWMEESPEPERFKDQDSEVSEAELKHETMSNDSYVGRDSISEEEQRLLSLRSSLDQEFDVSTLSLNPIHDFSTPPETDLPSITPHR